MKTQVKWKLIKWKLLERSPLNRNFFKAFFVKKKKQFGNKSLLFCWYQQLMTSEYIYLRDVLKHLISIWYSFIILLDNLHRKFQISILLLIQFHNILPLCDFLRICWQKNTKNDKTYYFFKYFLWLWCNFWSKVPKGRIWRSSLIPPNPNDTKILIFKLLEDITFKNFLILIECVINDDGKFNPQFFIRSISIMKDY